ncbi:regulator of G-protein signaling 20-like isoform X2 [Brienomyrus brachyistius]|uniref:regulator of G-protein signaling 20-like isoform X2 n=2 Tax=Brienomyrus brachyistius TaxID=42636 RepID=UPI0020B3739F|nr:regulator of G-protein signaling 20-like isoform X2 [Brienomyrus brachyistius]
MWRWPLVQFGACCHGNHCRTPGGSDEDLGENVEELVSCQPMGSERMEMRKRQRMVQHGAADDGWTQRGLGSPASNACCFCWCCCCSCSCLTAKNEEGDGRSCGTAHDAKTEGSADCEDSPKPTLEEVQSWGQSFDRLMKCPMGRKAFREFLRTEFSEENMLFWLACEDLKHETGKVAIEENARLIYEDYISILSPKEVSLDSRVREAINRNMLEPTSHTFDDAQLQIYTLMQRDSYPRYMNSSVYKNLLQTLSEQCPES